MNKDTLIALIEKDIAELQTLTQGFAEMETFPQPLIDLAVTKVESLRHCLTAMPEAARDSVRTEPEMPAPVPDEASVIVTEPAAVVESAAIVEPEPTLIVEPEPIPEVCEDVDNQPNADVATPDETAAQIVAETIHKPETVIDAFEKQQENESLAATIAHRPVTDLKRAISIAEQRRANGHCAGCAQSVHLARAGRSLSRKTLRIAARQTGHYRFRRFDKTAFCLIHPIIYSKILCRNFL